MSDRYGVCARCRQIRPMLGGGWLSIATFGERQGRERIAAHYVGETLCYGDAEVVFSSLEQARMWANGKLQREDFGDR